MINYGRERAAGGSSEGEASVLASILRDGAFHPIEEVEVPMCGATCGITGVAAETEGYFVAITGVAFLAAQCEVLLPVNGLSLIDALSGVFIFCCQIGRDGKFAGFCCGEVVPEKADGMLSCLMGDDGSHGDILGVFQRGVEQPNVVGLGDGLSVVHAVFGSAVAGGVGVSSEHFSGVVAHGVLLGGWVSSIEVIVVKGGFSKAGGGKRGGSASG